VRGPANALVTVVELGDYQDPFCKRVQPALAELRTLYGDDLRFVFKHAPLPFHPLAEPAAELAAEAYARRGAAGFWKAHEALWTASPKLAMPQLLDIALRSGLDAHAARAAIVDKRHAAVIGADVDLGKLLRAKGVPHFFVNGRRLVGAQPVEAFRRVIDEELLAARELVQNGIARERVYDEIMRFAMTPPAPTPPATPPPPKPQRR
jgi:protein-disulfide isomerase